MGSALRSCGLRQRGGLGTRTLEPSGLERCPEQELGASPKPHWPAVDQGVEGAAGKPHGPGQFVGVRTGRQQCLGEHARVAQVCPLGAGDGEVVWGQGQQGRSLTGG